MNKIYSMNTYWRRII